MSTSNRVTEKQLQAVVDRINRIMGTPLQPYGENINGRCNPQANCYHLSFAYGGAALHCMSDKAGCTGVRDIFGYHMPKRELMEKMQAFISGIYEKQELSKAA